MGLGEACTKLACFSERKDDDQSAIDFQREMAHLREFGQTELRAIIGDPNEGVDWKAVMSKAAELHEQEQEWIQQRQIKERKKREKRVLARRKRNDRSGAFATNLLNFRPRKGYQSIDRGVDELTLGLLSATHSGELRSPFGSQLGTQSVPSSQSSVSTLSFEGSI